jgi:DNA-binding NarL/FixJ family response regulator
VAVIADHEIQRRRIAATLSRGGVAAVVRYSQPEDLVASSRRLTPDAVVVCWERLGEEEVASLRSVKDALPTTRIIAVASSFARAALAAALDNGLDGFVRETDVDDCLLLAIESAQRGQVSLPREFCKIVTRPALSMREKQILALVVMGFSNAEIAQKLFIAESTVKSHLSSAFARLGVRSRNQATALILDPDRGLGAGILTISGDERRSGRPS